MSTLSDCIICQKHLSLSQFTGEPLLERGGLVLTHFPKVASEPATTGRLLIEPLRHVEDFVDLNETEASALGPMIKMATHVLRNTLGAEHVYLFRINDKVRHLHFHLVPRFPNTPQEFWGLRILEWRNGPGPGLELADIQTVSRRLRSELAKSFDV